MSPGTLWPCVPEHGESDVSALLSSPEFRRWHNDLRIMRSLDEWELLRAGVIDTAAEWEAFEADPYRFAIKASGTRAAALYRLINTRRPADLRDAALKPGDVERNAARAA